MTTYFGPLANSRTTQHPQCHPSFWAPARGGRAVPGPHMGLRWGWHLWNAGLWRHGQRAGVLHAIRHRA